MKLAILAQSYLHDKTSKINGTLVQLHNLAHGFVKNGIEVHYIATTKDRSKEAYEVEDGIHFHWIQSQKGLFEWKRVMALYKNSLESVSPNAVYVRGRNVLQYVAGNYSKQNKIPFVWGTNGDDSAEFNKNIKRLKSSQKPALKKLLLLPLKAFEDVYINKGMSMPTSIVNQSIEQKESVKTLLQRDGLVLPSYFLPVEIKSEKRDVILWLATLSKQKQPEIFIELINRLNLNEWTPILAGGTENKTYSDSIDKKVIGTKIQTTGKVEFEDSFSYYQQAKIYINTSLPHADGLPNAYIQSWLSGAVVLSLHHDPNNWMEDYNIGFCANGDINIFVNELQALIDDEKKLLVMSNNAIEFAQKKFSSPDIIEKYITLFKGSI